MFFFFQVVGIQQYLIRPNVANTNDNFLSSEILLEPSITEELVRKSLSLDYVIFQVSIRHLSFSFWEFLRRVPASVSGSIHLSARRKAALCEKLGVMPAPEDSQVSFVSGFDFTIIIVLQFVGPIGSISFGVDPSIFNQWVCDQLKLILVRIGS